MAPTVRLSVLVVVATPQVRPGSSEDGTGQLTAGKVVSGDAGIIGSYAGAVPAHVVLVCGVFGNISDDDVANTVATLPAFCEPGAIVIWTRHRPSPDLTPAIRAWFEEAGFAEVAFDEPTELSVGVGDHRLVGDPRRAEATRRLFEFTGDA